MKTRIAAALLLSSLPSLAVAGSFIGSNSAPERVMHPVGTRLLPPHVASPTTTVCLDPAGLPASGNAEQSIRNAIATFNRLTAEQGNVVSGASAGVAGGQVDFESVFLHELGHCIGMDHNVLGPSEVGGCSLGNAGTCQSDPSLFATVSTKGVNNSFQVNAGGDGQRASRDDTRGDDTNRHWYRRNVNNPFEMPPATVDRQTYAVTTGFLPGGHTYPEAATSHSPCSSPSSNTAALPGRVANTENVMFPVLCSANAIRELAPDDVTTLRIARAGVDGVQGTSDDYVPQISYAGITDSCDVVLRFSGSGVGFCSVSFQVNGNNSAIVSGSITVGQTTSIPWHFNQTDTTVPASADLSVAAQVDQSPAPVGAHRVYTATVSNAGASQATSLQLTANLPAGTAFVGASGSGYTCGHAAGVVTCTRASLNAAASAAVNITVHLPLAYAGASTLTLQASASSAVNDGNAGNNSTSVATPVDFIAPFRIFGGPVDGSFESP